jgi:hypothetical protein
LLGFWNPSAIAGFVVAVVIDSFNGPALPRKGRHVLQECGETIAPAFTDRNSATSIVTISGMVGEGTSLLHASPKPIFFAFSHAVNTGVPAIYRTYFTLKTSTAFSVSIFKTTRTNDCDIAAIAIAYPEYFLAFR